MNNDHPAFDAIPVTVWRDAPPEADAPPSACALIPARGHLPGRSRSTAPAFPNPQPPMQETSMAKTQVAITLKAAGDDPEEALNYAIHKMLDYGFTPISLKRDAEKHTAQMTVDRIGNDSVDF